MVGKTKKAAKRPARKGAAKKQAARKPSLASYMRKARVLSMRNTLAGNAAAVELLKEATKAYKTDWRAKARRGYQTVKKWLHDAKEHNKTRDDGHDECKYAYFGAHQDWYTNWAYGIAARYQKNFDESDDRYAEALRLVPAAPADWERADVEEFYAEYAEYLVYKGNPRDALDWLRVKLGGALNDPKRPGWFRFVRAWAYHQRADAGDYRKALDDLDWLEGQNNLDKDALLVRAASYIGLGNTAAGQQAMSEFLRGGQGRDEWTQVLEAERGTFWRDKVAQAHQAHWISHLAEAGLL